MRLMIVSLALVAAACSAATGDETVVTGPTEETSAPSTEAVPVVPPVAGELPEGPSALQSPLHEDFPPALIDVFEIIAVLPPDSIPAVDEPFFVSIAEADEYLAPDEPVVVVDVNGDARAYPIQILAWHEIVNDTVGGVPIAITYCPLCNSAVSYERRIGGTETTFGTSGTLFNSALIMYDRATETMWTHYDGRAVLGLLTGHQLAPVASPLLAWSDFVDAYPDGLVLDRERTGASRPYGTNPYAGYDRAASGTYFPVASDDERLLVKERVVGVAINGVARAWALEAVSGGEAKATNGELGGTSLVIFWKSGQASAFEGADNPDVGSVAVFRPVAEGRQLTFETEGGEFRDRETGSLWDITGRAIGGELTGLSLERIHHLDTFWFAWSSYQPDTELVEAG